MDKFARFLHIICICLLLAMSAVCYPQQQVTLTGLPNGLRVVVCTRTEAPLVSIHLRVHSGSAADDPASLGTAHACEHLIFSGTSTRGPGMLDYEIEGLGATLQATTTRDTIQLSTVVAKKYWEQVDALIADAVQNAAIPEKEFAREQMIILQELARRSNEPRYQAEDELWKVLFADSPYAHPIGGTNQSVVAMKREALLKFIRANFVPNNCTLVLTGDITADEALPIVRKHYAHWFAQALPTVTAPTMATGNNLIRRQLNSVSSQRVMAFGFTVPGISSGKDALACDALLYLLSAPEAYLRQQLTAQKLANRIDGRYTTSRWPTLLYISLPISDDTNTQMVEKIVSSECIRLAQQGPTQDELSKAVRQLTGQQLFLEETLDGTSVSLGLMDSIADYRKSLSYISDIRSLSTQDIQMAARKYLIESPKAIVVVDPMKLQGSR